MKTHVAFEIDAPTSEWERIAAELAACETLGWIERDEGFVAYFKDGASAPALQALADPRLQIAVRGPLSVPDQDWERGWREGLAPRRVAGLWIRPSWFAPCQAPEIVIDPQQAFGSGEHATTRLALELLLRALRPGDALFDVGTGSGILALAALRCGAGAALGVDLDAAACENARENAERNALPLRLARATPAALRPGRRFALVVANLLASELGPCLAPVADSAGRELILSGYLAAERGLWPGPLQGLGWEQAEEREEAQAGDVWVASRWRRLAGA